MSPEPEHDWDQPKPDWWLENEKLRQQMELPSYTPPQFKDGTFSHEIRTELEEAHECTIQIKSENTRYPDDLEVWVDGEEAFTIERHRNKNGNTIYDMTADEFHQVLKGILDSA